MPGVDGSSARADGVPMSPNAPLRRSGAPLGRLLAALGAIGAIWLIAASRWIVTDTVVPWDSKNQFYAFFRFLASALHSGASPFWNPYHYGGHPSVADPQSLVFAPFFVLWALFDDAPSLRAFDLIVYAHLLAGGLAIGIIGARARWPVAACVLAAALFMFGGAAAGRLQHTGIILSYGLFPPALLLLELALERRSILLAAAFAVVAAPLLLTMQFAALSNRPVTLIDTALKGSLYPADLAQLMVADIFGSQGQYWGPSAGRLPELALTDDSFNYMFVGSVPLVLLLWFGIAGGRALRRGRMLMTAVLMVALLYALGRYTPLFSWAFAWVPGVDKFRRPVDADFVLLAALALLAGQLLADYVREGLPRVRIPAG